MTGAPKRRSIDILHGLEDKTERGPYSGSLGYIGLDGIVDLNIIIRSAVVTPCCSLDEEMIAVEGEEEGEGEGGRGKENNQKNKDYKVTGEEKRIGWNVRIGAGGAITALSDSDDEFDEMMLKARAVQESVREWAGSSSSSF